MARTRDGDGALRDAAGAFAAGAFWVLPTMISSWRTTASADSACAFSSSLAAALSSAVAAVVCVTFSICAIACDTWSIPCVCCRLASRTSSTIPFTRVTLSVIAPIDCATCSTVPFPSCDRVIDSSISPAVSFAACADRCARLRTSSATTAKPMPASPARAASTAAFSARMFVWNAISSIVLMIFATFADDSESPPSTSPSRSAPCSTR